MTWQPTADDLPAIEAALRRAFPALSGRIAPLRVLGDGFRAVAVETADGWVFRIGKNDEATAGFAREARLLPALHGRLPVAIPDPRWYAEPSTALPYGALGYPKLPGRSLQPAMLARMSTATAALACQMAALLVALHGISAAEAGALGVPMLAPDMLREMWVRERDRVLPALRELLAQGEYAAVARWWEALLADERMRTFAPVLRHGDLWYENILVNERTLRMTGVLDFEEAALGDPAQDFATQLHLGKRFADAVLDAYARSGGIVDGTLRYRIWRLWELRVFDGLRFAVEHPEAGELADALAKLRASPILRRGV